jgi:hypothetical protein
MAKNSGGIENSKFEARFKSNLNLKKKADG